MNTENTAPLELVEKFHQLFQHPILESPQIPDEQRCDLRFNLMQEELNEFLEAVKAKDIVEIADALADLQYVLSGTILEFGFGKIFNEIFAEVHRSNMSKACFTELQAIATVDYNESKSGDKHHYEERDGKYFVYRSRDMKTVKSIDYSAAEIRSIVKD